MISDYIVGSVRVSVTCQSRLLPRRRHKQARLKLPGQTWIETQPTRFTKLTPNAGSYCIEKARVLRGDLTSSFKVSNAGRYFRLCNADLPVDPKADDKPSSQAVDDDETCSCPSKIVSRQDFKATFEGLDRKDKYFAMVSRFDHGAFFGVPSEAVRPSHISEKRTASKVATQTSPSKPQSKTRSSPAKSLTTPSKSKTYGASTYNSSGGFQHVDYSNADDDDNEPAVPWYNHGGSYTGLDNISSSTPAPKQSTSGQVSRATEHAHDQR